MNRYKVTILRNTYSINTEGDEAHIRKIEKDLRTRLDVIFAQKPNISAIDALSLLALNLMDELIDSGENTDRMREQLTQYLADAARARIELDDARKEIDRLRGNFTTVR